MNDIERAAAQMGMKCSEVLEVVPVDDGRAVRTHDEQWTLVRDDGTTRPGEAPEVTLERDSGVDDVVPEDPKPAAKRRGRS